MESYVGWLGVLLGMSVPVWQIRKLLKTKSGKDVSIATYVALICAMSCYLFEAIRIVSWVFITAQSINIILNTFVLVWLLRNH